MAEWSIAAVLKTVVLRGTGGSNPSLSARKKQMKYSNLFEGFHLLLLLRRFAATKSNAMNPIVRESIAWVNLLGIPSDAVSVLNNLCAKLVSWIRINTLRFGL